MEKITITEKKLEKGKWTITGADGRKFSFWETKQDGSRTKAFEQFTKYQIGVGMTVDAEVKENPWTDKNGNQHKGFNVLYFKTDEHGTPYVQDNKNAPQRNLGANNDKLVEHFNRLAERVAKLEQHLFGPKHLHATADELGDLPVVDLEPKDEIKPSDLPF